MSVPKLFCCEGGDGLDYATSTNDIVYALKVGAGDRVLAVGSFSRAGTFYRTGAASFNAALNILRPMWSSHYLSFGSYVPAAILDAAMTSGGGVWFVGPFQRFHNQDWIQVALASMDGTPSGSFSPGSGMNYSNSVVSCGTFSDDSVLVGGGVLWNGTSVPGYARIDGSGALVGAFSPGTAGAISAFIYPYGSDVLINGTDWDGTTITNFVAKISASGVIDSSFNSAGAISYPGPSGNHTPGQISTDGIGDIYLADSLPNGNVVKISSSGVLDGSFNAPTVGGGSTYCCAYAGAGKVYVGGTFTSMDGDAHIGLARLNGGDGTLDTGFTCNLNSGGYLLAVKVLSNGNIVIGGSFDHVAGVARSNIALITPSGTVL